jgi:hypothetical protein
MYKQFRQLADMKIHTTLNIPSFISQFIPSQNSGFFSRKKPGIFQAKKPEFSTTWHLYIYNWVTNPSTLLGFATKFIS